jgi:hypothetical protein
MVTMNSIAKICCPTLLCCFYKFRCTLLLNKSFKYYHKRFIYFLNIQDWWKASKNTNIFLDTFNKISKTFTSLNEIYTENITLQMRTPHGMGYLVPSHGNPDWELWCELAWNYICFHFIWINKSQRKEVTVWLPLSLRIL